MLTLFCSPQLLNRLWSPVRLERTAHFSRLWMITSHNLFYSSLRCSSAPCSAAAWYVLHSFAHTHALPYIPGYAAYRSIVESCSPTPRGPRVQERERESVGKNAVGKKWAWKKERAKVISRSDMLTGALLSLHDKRNSPEKGGRPRWMTPGLTRGILNTHAYTRAFILLVLKTCFSDMFTLWEEEEWMLSRQAFFPQSVCMCFSHLLSFHNIVSGLTFLHIAATQGWGDRFRENIVTMVMSLSRLSSRRSQGRMQNFYYVFLNVDLICLWLYRCPLLMWRRATGTHWNVATATRTARIKPVPHQAKNYVEMSNREVWCVVFGGRNLLHFF